MRRSLSLVGFCLLLIQLNAFSWAQETVGLDDVVLPKPLKVKLTVDGYLFNREGVGGDYPVLLTNPFPAPTLLRSDELEFDSELGGRFELTIYDQTPNPTDLHFTYFTTGNAEAEEVRMSNPADAVFFGGVAANPSDVYTVQHFSKLQVGEVGLHKTLSPYFGVHAGLSGGRLEEVFDTLSQVNPPSGFFSYTKNKLYGAQLGLDSQVWSNGYLKLDGHLTGGLYYNDIEVHARSLEDEFTWSEEDTAFLGTAGIALVIPASPVNFRIGYQATYLSGVALAMEQSRQLSHFDGTGQVPTGDTVYHGLLFGIEWLR